MTEIKSIGILSIGEMGHACAHLFRQNGARVLTVLEGRSERTRALARDAGVEVLGDLKALVGRVRYDPNGDLVDQRIFIFKIENGRFVQVAPK